MTLDIAAIYPTIIPRYPELRGQLAIITGSSKGIGQGVAARLAREGMKVVINSRTPETVEATAAQLRAVGAEAIGVPADLSTDEGINRLFAETERAYGTVHLLVNNAADLRRYHFFEMPEGMVDYQLAASVRAPYVCAERAAAIMRRDGHGGSIINISSIGGLRAHWRGLPYDVAKGAINSMTQAMALELIEFGIRVNAIAPGPIEVGKSPPPGDPRLQAWINRVPSKRLGTPLDIGGAVAFLASPDADYIIGQVLVVDGGVVTQISPRDQPV
jgi:NAD(P)-dependent dehydrogenase (short-subunit alcohol dehydrogenase family)